MEQFSPIEITTSETTIFIKKAGSGPPVLLLHGFPQTHHMWRHIGQRLAEDFTVVVADLRGYGASGCPPSTKDHTPYSKRTMAKDMVEVMRQLGFTEFAVAGHDRGGRVAYRMALDYPEVVKHLAVFDIVPTDTAWDNADDRMMLAFWPWSVFAQPEPLPERIMQASAPEIVNNACDAWGSSPDIFEKETREIYIQALKDPEHIHAICEEYRAAASIDREHDAQDRRRGRTISCPALVLWGAGGALDTWYEDKGGPLALWRQLAPRAFGEAVSGGHFFPEETPEKVIQQLHALLRS